jgi:RHS repeat-associated protein
MYTVDAQGRRVRKFSSTGAASTVVYAYDASGHLLGEYDSTGKELREYVWLGDTPIAVFTPDPTGPSLKPPLVYYVHTDHIAAPRIVLDKANNIRWRWLAEPFGSTAAEENPSALGALQVALRLPGQLFDAESSLHYNYFRDYDPSVGRYLQSDPIGLAGGINTYAYVGGNPVSYVDPTGEYGLPGFLAGGAFNLGFQFFSNLYLSDGDWKLAARCIDFTDVLVSAGIGALGPGAWGQVIRGKPGPLGLTRGQDTYVYLTRSLPAGFFLKQGLPSLRVADDCECKDLKLTGAISKFLH